MVRLRHKWDRTAGNVKVLGWGGVRAAPESEAGSVGSGIFIGGIWGVIVSAVVLAFASLMSEQPAGNAPPAAPQLAVPEAAPDSSELAAETAPDSGPLFEAPDAPLGSLNRDSVPDTPRVDVPAGVGLPPAADTDPATIPRTGDEDAGPEPLAQAPEVADLEPAPIGDEPVLPTPQAQVIEVPQRESDISVATAPPAPTDLPAEVVVLDPETDISDAPEVVAVVPRPVITDLPGLDIAAAPESADQDGQDDRMMVVTEAPLAPALPETAETGAAALPAPEQSRASVRVNGATNRLPGRDVGVTVRRFGSTDSADADAAAAEVDILPEDAPALLRHAAEFSNPAGQPLLSVVLIDDGALADAVPAAAAIPFPVSIAIDPEAPDATARMQGWRAAGYEVLVLARLPRGARPTDVEITYEAAFAALPDTVAVLDAGEGGLSSDSAVTAQAIARLARDGRGLVTVTQGLATPVRLAQNAGVPVAEVYRDLDDADQSARVIRRFLDQAAFRARQQGAVVLVARVRPETIEALTSWGGNNRADQVAASPVSAVLRERQSAADAG